MLGKRLKKFKDKGLGIRLVACFRKTLGNVVRISTDPPDSKNTIGTDSSGRAGAIDPESWVEKYSDDLFGFAITRVRDRAIAQDLVQETFLAGIRSSGGYSGRSDEKGWLFGILRHKLADHYRRQFREMSVEDIESTLPEEEGAFGASGPHKDGWLKRLAPKAWERPDESLVNKEFQEVFRSCLSRLPAQTAQAFFLREVDGVTSEEICKDLGISPNNFWVMLHRARMGLRRCLEVHWFGQKEKVKPAPIAPSVETEHRPL